jgi:hypothetical protein
MKVARQPSAYRVSETSHPAALHGLDDQAQAAPGVEPPAQRRDLGRRPAELEEAEGGDK